MSQEPEMKKSKKQSNQAVMTYLFILIAAAFALLLLSYFMQQRANEDQVENLTETSNSAVESMLYIVAERDALKEEVAGMEATVDELNQALLISQGETQAVQTQTDALQLQLDALCTHNHLRSLYNEGQYEEARAFLVSIDRTALEAQLALVSQSMTTEQRAVYDPLTAFAQLVEWLSE